MPFFLLIIGLIVIVAGIRSAQSGTDLIGLVKSDFSGSNNFFLWVLAIILVVAVGQVKAIRPISDAFLGLLILVIIIANYKHGGDLLNSFVSQVKAGMQ